MRYFVTAIVIIFGFLSDAISQNATSIATAQATIVQPLSLSNIRGLTFGNITSGETDGTVVLEPKAAGTRRAYGGVRLVSESGTVQSAKFIVTGFNDCAYVIKLPSAITLRNGVQSIIVDNFASIPSGTGILSSGSQIIYVGATLNVNANQQDGDYTGEFEVLVNYY